MVDLEAAATLGERTGDPDLAEEEAAPYRSGRRRRFVDPWGFDPGSRLPGGGGRAAVDPRARRQCARRQHRGDPGEEHEQAPENDHPDERQEAHGNGSIVERRRT
jgi:hypothetical protein